MLKDLLTGGIEGVAKAVGGIIDQFVESDEDKLTARLQIETIISAREAIREESYRAELEAKKALVVAELQQDDLFTKRARPTVIYSGLAFIFFNYVIAPLFTAGYQSLALPVEFWAAWGGVTGAYVIGRSREKNGSTDRLTKVLSG